MFLYYIGGPRDLHKVAITQEPERTQLIREPKGLPMRKYPLTPGSPLGEMVVEYTDHLYQVHRMGANLYVAIHIPR